MGNKLLMALVILVLPESGFLEPLDVNGSVPTAYPLAEGISEDQDLEEESPVSITIGHPSPYLDHPISLPALERGIRRYLSEGRRPKLNISVVYDTGCCLPKKATSSVVKMTQAGVDAILGNYCSGACVPAGYYLSAENFAFWPSGCASEILTDKSVFNTVVRLYPSGTTVGPAFLKIFQHYNWTNAVIWSRAAGTCEFGSISIVKHFRDNNITVAEWIRTSDDIQPFSDREMDDYLARMKSRGRVMIICHQNEQVLKMMMRAHTNGMTGSDFVYLLFSLVPSTFLDYPWLSGENQTEAEIIESKRAFLAMKEVTIADMTDSYTRFYVDSIRTEANQRWNISFTERIHISCMILEDLTYLYLSVLGDILQDGGTRKDIRNGTNVYERAKKRLISGATGRVTFDSNRDRTPEFWIMQYTPGAKQYMPFAYVRQSAEKMKFVDEFKKPYWRTADGRPPPALPLCGFKGEKCPVDHTSRNIALVVCAVIGLALGIFVVVMYVKIRNKRQEEELQCMIWKISYDDLKFVKSRVGSVSAISSRAVLSKVSDSASARVSLMSRELLQKYTQVASYKDVLVAVKTYTMEGPVNLTRSDLVELKVMKEMSHDNINPFVGACIDLHRVCSLSNYCTRGSLQDILENEEVKLDWMFKSSLINDIVNGMCYLHDSPLVSHGCLKSSNCLVDSRWVLKLSNFGLTAFKIKRLQGHSEYAQSWRQLWTAPELLRCESPPVNGTPAGDVYSFAIILQEILYRAVPYFVEPGQLTPKEIITKLREARGEPFRPPLPNDNSGQDIDFPNFNATKSLMQACWAQDPSTRPAFKHIRKIMRQMNRGKGINIVDIMIEKLEKYASNLEDIVVQRTSALLDEKKKTDSLLYRMLPPSVADELKKGLLVEPELYDEVSVCFSDIVGFTTLSSESTPMEIVNLLNDLYTTFDGIIDAHDVYKVETIGDAYMVVSGLPQKNGSLHIAKISHMALDLLSEIINFKIRHRPDQKLKLRVGIHTGPCAAGVVGLAMPRYCLFGDTVNVASRMESTGEGLRIQLSSDAQAALTKYPQYQTVERGRISIKGKGDVLTYWLIGKEHFNKPLPKMEEIHDALDTCA